jgi:hypothetical protein
VFEESVYPDLGIQQSWFISVFTTLAITLPAVGENGVSTFDCPASILKSQYVNTCP